MVMGDYGSVFVAALVLFVLALPVIISIPAVVVRFVTVAYPLFLHEIHRLATSVVAPTVFVPVFLVAWRYVQVYGLLLYEMYGWSDQNWLGIYQLWLRKIADVYASIDTGLVDPNGHTNRGLRTSCAQGAQYHCQRK